MAKQSDPEARRCPGENYDINLPICHGRQAKNYLPCRSCQWHEGGDRPKTTNEFPRESLRAFKAYDIRGAYPELVNEKAFGMIGAATAKFLGAKTMLVTHDMRESSVPLAEAVVEGITDFGTDVLMGGLASTDANYFAIGHYNAGGGIQVTASHNPPGDNGMKISREKAMPIGQDTGLDNIKKLACGPRPRAVGGCGKVRKVDIMGPFTEHVLSFGRNVPSCTVVIDAGNGMAGHMLPSILKKLPIKAFRMYFKLDGSFPNHEANPLKYDTLRALQRRVVREGADMGIAFDADGDRCGFVDERGDIISGDLVTALIARSVLRRLKRGAIVYDVRSSRVVDEVVREAGGVPVRERVGHAFMKATMRTRNAPFGGELSGHYYFRDNYFTESGAIAMMHMLNVLGEENRPLSDVLEPLRKYFATGELNFTVEDKEAKIIELAEQFGDGKIDYKDGITVQYDNWWFNVRPSNTEPLLRLNLEADTADLMEEKRDLLAGVLQR